MLVAVFGALFAGCPGEERPGCDAGVSCDDLLSLACGDDGECATTQSCAAAQELGGAGDDAACHSAWCDLGEAYAACK